MFEWHKATIQVETRGKGLHNITPQLEGAIREWGIRNGILHIFIQHTSASLVVNESYDPSAREDLEAFMDHLVPEGQSYFRHTLEGADDSPSHMRAMLTTTSLSIPVDDGQLSLGTWQGVYLFEHRRQPHARKILLRGMSVD
jgi:secondary thiamine-phosphate synthase enzyme